MKKRNISIVAATVATALFVAAPVVQASGFSGYSAGAKAGLNFASDGVTSGTAFTVGIEGGYLMPETVLNLPSNFRVGGDAFLDLNMSTSHTYTVNYYGVTSSYSYSYGTDVLGADAKVGYVMGQFMPYAKLGLAEVIGTGGGASGSSIGLHGGIGAEYLLSQAAGVTAEWTYDSANELDNNNITLGAIYHF
jgi:hypothetical protein